MDGALVSQMIYIARMKTLLAKVKSLHRRDRYRLYMSMMGSDPFEVDGTDWAYTLHRMVAGSHNIASYERQVVALEKEMRDGVQGDDVTLEGEWRKLYQADSHLLDPILDLVHRKIDEFYTYAGRPD